MNLIIVDDKQLMAGSFCRYLKHRFGRSVNVSSVTDAPECLEKINGDSKVIILDYPFDGQRDTEHGVTLIKAIKEQRPQTDVILLSAADDVRKDMVRNIKQLERRASNYIIRSSKSPINIALSAIENSVVQPIRIFAEEHSIAEFLGLFFASFIVVGLVVLLARLFIKM